MQLRIYFILFLTMGFAGQSFAQCASTNVKPSKSSGIVLSVSKVGAQGKSINLQFVANNTTQSRIYVIDARVDDSQKAFLGSGEHLYSPNVSSIETAAGFTAQSCMSNPGCSQNLDLYSYIEPGENLPFSFLYNTNNVVDANDKISFSVAFIARYTKPGDDPTRADRPRIVRFSFTYIPICQ